MVSQAIVHRVPSAPTAPASSVSAPLDRFEIRLSSQFSKRCLQLARAAHLDGTARLTSLRGLFVELRVPSKSRTTEYDVVCDRAGSVWCTCKAGEHHKPCGHAGAGLAFMRQMHNLTAAYAPTPAPNGKKSGRGGHTDEAMQWWLAGGEW